MVSTRIPSPIYITYTLGHVEPMLGVDLHTFENGWLGASYRATFVTQDGTHGPTEGNRGHP
jgi:hypothetical protein